MKIFLYIVSFVGFTCAVFLLRETLDDTTKNINVAMFHFIAALALGTTSFVTFSVAYTITKRERRKRIKLSLTKEEAIRQLNTDLNKALDRQDYEKAAQIRDELAKFNINSKQPL